MSRSKAPTCVTAGVLVCTGKHCRKEKGFADLLATAAGTARAHEVPCQDVCKGPVGGCTIDGEVRWFAKLRKPKQQAALLRAFADGAVPDRLAKREQRKRRGQVRGARRMHPLDAPRAEELIKAS